jgi:hypothetical protein
MHKVLYTGIGLSLIPTIACAATAASQVVPGGMHLETIGGAHLVILCFGLFLAGYWAVEAFSRPSVTLGEIPTLPKYMTRSAQYMLGVVTFTAISMLLYSVVAYLHREALPIIQYFIPEVYKHFQPYVEGEHPSYLAVIVLVSGAYVVLLKYESDWNVLLILRNVIQSWVAIPSMANTLLTLTRDTLVVPHDGAAIVIGNPATPYVAADRQRVADQARDALPQGVIETLDVVGFPSVLRDRLVSLCRNHTCVGIILICIEDGLLTGHPGDLGPQRFGTAATPITDVKRNHLAGLSVHGNPDPLPISLLLHEAPRFIGFGFQPSKHHVGWTRW